MEITMRYVRGHVEVYTAAGQFLFSADTEAEAAAMLGVTADPIVCGYQRLLEEQNEHPDLRKEKML